MDKIKNFFRRYPNLEEYIPFPYAYLAEESMQEKYNELDNKTAKINMEDHDSKEFIKIIQMELEKEYERKKVIEDKAKSSIFVIALSLTFILSSLSFIYSKTFWIVSETPNINNFNFRCYVFGIFLYNIY